MRIQATDIDGIILAAGLSRRMGGNKLLLPFRGRPLLARVLELAVSLPLASVILVTRPETAAGIALPAGVRLVINPAPERGQASSLGLGLAAAGGRGYLFFAADQPLLDAATVLAVLARAEAEAIVAPAHRGVAGSPVFFPAAFRAELLALQGDAGGRILLRRHPQAVHYVNIADEGPLLDVDTPEEYARLRQKDLGTG